MEGMKEDQPKVGKFEKPLLTSRDFIPDPVVYSDEVEKRDFKIYVSKVGYKWEMAGKSGIAQRIKIALGKLDEFGDVIGKKKQINLPVMSPKVAEELFGAVVRAIEGKVLDENGKAI